MKSFICICAMLIFVTNHMNPVSKSTFNLTDRNLILKQEGEQQEALSPMEALDLVKNKYAMNFEKLYYEDCSAYYYKLSIAAYYLVYEGEGDTKDEYLFHLYEFVIDEPDTGIGHTVTYGWYTVNKVNRRIKNQMGVCYDNVPEREGL